MRRPNVFLLAIIAVALNSTIVSLAQQTLLTRHVREVVLNGQTQPVGRLPANESLHIDVVLPLRDHAGLENFLQELYDPSSPFLPALPHGERAVPTVPL